MPQKPEETSEAGTSNGEGDGAAASKDTPTAPNAATPNAAKPPPAAPAVPDAPALAQQLKESEAANLANVDALLQATRTANPAIPADLITGSTPAEITASVTAGQATVEQVLEANKTTTQPGGGGAPPRPTGPEQPPEGLSAVARMSWALSHPGPGSTEPPA